MMLKTKEIIVILALILIIGIILYIKFKIEAPTPIDTFIATETISFNPTLREVDFCGNKYKTRDAVIDGVNIIQRISEIANEKYYKEFSTNLEPEKIPNNFNNVGLNICANILSAKNTYESTPQNSSTQTLEINNNKASLIGTKIKETGKVVYNIEIESEYYLVSVPNNEIEQMNRFDGSYKYFGKLK